MINKLGGREELRMDADDLLQVCRDLPESACQEQPRNYPRHVVSLSLTRLGEGLADTKLVLAWLLDAIGGPTWTIGLFVPIRESLAKCLQNSFQSQKVKIYIDTLPVI